MQNLQFGLQYQSDLSRIDHKEEYLRKTIEVKNKNIDELLKELRETKELYQEYKNQYLAEQKKMKTKVLQLSNKLDLQTTQLQKHKLLSNKIKCDYQNLQEKEKKNAQNNVTQLRELTSAKHELQQKLKGALKENSQLKERNEGLMLKLTKSEQKLKGSERQLGECQLELRNARAETKAKNVEWQEERNRLLNQLEGMKQRTKQKQRVNLKLQAIQNKIISTLRKI